MLKRILAVSLTLLLALGALNLPAISSPGAAYAQAQPTPPPQPTAPPQGSGGTQGAQPTPPAQPTAPAQQAATPQPTSAPKQTQAAQPTQAPKPTQAPAPTAERYNVSSWAVEYITNAKNYGILPDAFNSADLAKPVNRREFAAVAVKVYENLTGAKITPVSNNPFSDTNDPEVIKAYSAGITSGTNSAGTLFSPDDLLSREQMATMLTRVLKAAYIPGWKMADDASYSLNFTQPSKFSDDGSISDWAKQSVYYMAANALILGTDAVKNTFSPGESATREQSVTIAVRMVDNMKGKPVDYKKGSSGTTAPTQPTAQPKPEPTAPSQPTPAPSQGSDPLAGMWRVFEGDLAELLIFDGSGGITVESYVTKTSPVSIIIGRYTTSGGNFSIVDAKVDGDPIDVLTFAFTVSGDYLIIKNNQGDTSYYERIPQAAADFIRKSPYADVPVQEEKVNLYVPAVYFTELAAEDVLEDAKAVGAELVSNRDGSYSLIMTKEQQQKLLNGFKDDMDDFLDMLASDADCPEIKDVQYSKDYGSITFYAVCGLDDMGDWAKVLIYTAGFSAPIYQVYEGKGDAAQSVITVRNATTNALIGMYVSPDDLVNFFG
jgi:outer membrane biosynthesis protein TonB